MFDYRRFLLGGSQAYSVSFRKTGNPGLDQHLWDAWPVGGFCGNMAFFFFGGRTSPMFHMNLFPTKYYIHRIFTYHSMSFFIHTSHTHTHIYIYMIYVYDIYIYMCMFHAIYVFSLYRIDPLAIHGLPIWLPQQRFAFLTSGRANHRRHRAALCSPGTGGGTTTTGI